MRRSAFAAAAVMVAAGFGIAAWAYFQVPAGARIPIHWDAAGHANGFGSSASFFLSPGIAAGTTVLLILLPYIEPRRGRALLSMPLYLVVLLAIDAVFLVIELVTINAVLSGSSALVPKLVPALIGILFLVIAAFLPTVKSNFFIGIRTPWTLSSEEAWRKTHRLAAWTFGAAGLLILASAVAPPAAATWLILVAVAAGGGVPFAYSYIAWRGAHDQMRAGSTP